MLCVRTGLHGRLTPLLINLPRSQETLHIVLIRTNTTGDDKLLSSTLTDEMQPMNSMGAAGSSTATGAAGSNHTADSTVPPSLLSSEHHRSTESDPSAEHERHDITKNNLSGGMRAVDAEASSSSAVDMASGKRAKGKGRINTEVDNDRMVLWTNLEKAEDDLWLREEQLSIERLILCQKALEMEESERVHRRIQSCLFRWNTYALSGNEDLLSPLIFAPMPRPDKTSTPQIFSTENTVVAPSPTAQNTSADVTDTGDKDVWNKRQIGYVYILGTSLAVLFFLRPLLPAGYGIWMLAAFATIWGFGSVGLPAGMFGEKFPKIFSRHMGHVLYAAFSVLVIYSIYLLALSTPTSPLAPPPPSSPLAPAVHDNELWFWRLVFGFIGSVVLFGHLYLWARSCCTGVDQDPDL
ncbi:uncharacterized protein [Oryza sativa Japonica Group]|nr:uncharacterized protein LOC107276900 [Oryza sativa Japonica Group]EEC81592.1 hypothetical protein OsI_25062 [Oryza sativa Indica Group]EEE66648.1 hypothetical protein OsJ_23262 [Oryza sativa Japonica Group]KAF2921617.1 hypothetical protein DAI22_07g048150 [Oryza sativa Japonica Group]BAT00249.1 Os07g0171500 [Oryza sativa Japonica Group]